MMQKQQHQNSTVELYSTTKIPTAQLTDLNVQYKLRTNTTPNLSPAVAFSIGPTLLLLFASCFIRPTFLVKVQPSDCLSAHSAHAESSEQIFTIVDIASLPISHCIATSYGIIGMRKHVLPQRLIGADIHPNCRFQQHY
ncbi:hypothetical protein T4E_2916 [Trichinella pseudospiralis]|uniref:Uncharacterized protein n=1 Tax=Trichinella pseudospiralis TaxID=6337 RepID=A0A0V0XGW0_TRIPS|nr:hypothetical protein T4E_2916 [Trichinella pseudospiralis]